MKGRPRGGNARVQRCERTAKLAGLAPGNRRQANYGQRAAGVGQILCIYRLQAAPCMGNLIANISQFAPREVSCHEPLRLLQILEFDLCLAILECLPDCVDSATASCRITLTVP